MVCILCADISSADEGVYRDLYERASTDRKRRADRYLRYEDKLRCVTADALLRIALGTNEFQIEKNEFGKPYVKDRKDFCYNLSHSGHYVVIAWGTKEVGIDVQKHYTDTDMQMIAERCFTQDEKEYVLKSGCRRAECFYEIWTGKESYVKGIGKGLCKDMRSFSVLEQKPKIRLLELEEGYSLSFYTLDKKYTFELLDIRQL